MSGNTILGVFAKSPLKPLEKHIRKVSECAQILPAFFEASNSADWDKTEELRKQISKAEKEADAMKRTIRMELPGGIFMPVQRTDVLELVSQQDKIANISKDIAGRILGRQIVIPDDIAIKFNRYLARSIDAINKSADAINELDDLLETGFRGRELKYVGKLIGQLASIEDDTDAMQIELRQSLMGLEERLNPIDVMFLYQIIEWVGDLADTAERVGARLEIMLAR